MKHYKQTKSNSCGAASLLIALNHYKKINLSRKNELKLLRKSVFVPLDCVNVYRLATLARRFSVCATVVTESLYKLPIKNGVLSESLQKKLRANNKLFYKIAKQAGVKIIKKQIKVNDVVSALDGDSVVVAFVNGKPLGTNKMHAILLRKENGKIMCHDPLKNSAREIDLATLRKCLDAREQSSFPRLLLLKDMPKLAVICCLHGNETVGKYVKKKLEKFGSATYIIGNPHALRAGKRFIEKDLNRVFPGNKAGSYEERRAYQLTKLLKKFDYVVDLHSSSQPMPPFVIISKKAQEHVKLAMATGIKKIVYMSNYIAKGNALIDYCKCGISLELGAHKDKATRDIAILAIKNVIAALNGTKSVNLNAAEYQIIGQINRLSDNFRVNMKNFQFVRTKQQIGYDNNISLNARNAFYAVFVNAKSYNDVMSLIAKKVKTIKVLNRRNLNITK